MQIPLPAAQAAEIMLPAGVKFRYRRDDSASACSAFSALGLSPSDLASASTADNAPGRSTSVSSTASSHAPSSTSIPSTVVQLSLDSVHVGELAGPALYSSAWDAVSSKCADPPSTQCDIAVKTVSNVGTVVDSTSVEGEITFTIQDSFYSNVGERNAMMGAAIQALQQSATNQSCNPEKWVDKSGEKCPKKCKRVDLGLGGADSIECSGTSVICNAPNHISELVSSLSFNIFQLTLQPWNSMSQVHRRQLIWTLVSSLVLDLSFCSADRDLAIGWQLQGALSPFLQFLCEAIIEGVSDALVTVAPEVAPEDWATLGQVLPCCSGSCEQ